MDEFTINLAHNTNFRARFTNVPGLDDKYLHYFTGFLEKVTLPGLGLQQYRAGFVEHDEKGILDRENADNPVVTMGFKCSEQWENYFALYNWAWCMKANYDLSAKGPPTARYPYFKRNVITFLEVDVLNNQLEVNGTFQFSNVFIASLGSVGMDYRNPKHITFSAVFGFESTRVYAPKTGLESMESDEWLGPRYRAGKM